ncbi:8-oxo-dGTP pyrophosphatase MutT, NUDIX family [Sphingomonas gellani]|uniref:8-oxo-dGTP pyrophosphatase MutT, NUDIX family n=1 Tax=Sphingomonas gellani TaxID=1166340 RepID=A0A1H8EYV5_9SPHN|nr:CoA pyrophosphatase [Sphingomonas gellani]SEN24570.1 8-oxo-dGTP pyrophosphatase MutT, NUDIX family [Sphingomonas gellani]
MTLADRLAASLSASPSSETMFLAGDDGLLSDALIQLVPAAVLIAVIDRVEPGVILTERAATLRHHAGQIAFPGGRIDPGDESPVAAALREADEEIALPPEAVRVAGVTDRYRTGTGFDITPVVAVVPPGLPLRPSEAEVASVFEVPLRHLLDPANHRPAHAMWKGRERHFHEIQWQDRRIWGATAGIIVNLSRRLAWA